MGGVYGGLEGRKGQGEMFKLYYNLKKSKEDAVGKRKKVGRETGLGKMETVVRKHLTLSLEAS